jgi:hypothetical protein
LETRMLQMFESHFRHSLQQIRRMLQKLFARPASIVDNRGNNTRGGFGDVSPSHHAELTSSANPPDPRNSIQLHNVPPLNRNRPSLKIDFIGTSSSTSLIHVHSFIQADNRCALGYVLFHSLPSSPTPSYSLSSPSLNPLVPLAGVDNRVIV